MLYHASRKSGLKIIKPYKHNAVDGESVVFATTDERFALAMSHGSGFVLASSYAINSETGQREFYVDEIEKGALDLLNNSASVYILDTKGFKQDLRLKKTELISTNEAKVLKEVRIDNVLERLKELGAHLISYEDVPESMNNRGDDPDGGFEEYDEDRFKKVKD